MVAGRAEDDVEALNEESDEVDHNLEVATDKQNRRCCGGLCVSRKICLLMWKRI